MDIHESTTTVEEALLFSAKLRQPWHVPMEEKEQDVGRILDLLEMRELAGAVVGTPMSGLNVEQRKRLTIGVELASKPETLLFLDEPTSGLDSSAAANIARLLRKLAREGQSILATVHQPSPTLFEQFDDLILLKPGGRMIYHGPLGEDSSVLVDYLERNGAASKCRVGANPAEYMLEVTGAGNPHYTGPDWAKVWEQSAEKAEQHRFIDEVLSSAKMQEGSDDRGTDD